MTPVPSDVFVARTRVIQPEWIDANGHLNMAYYPLLVDKALEDFFAFLGLPFDQAEAIGQSVFMAEIHINYLNELFAGDRVEARVRIINPGARRLHLFCELWRADHALLSALSEMMLVSIDLKTRKSAPFGDEVRANLETMFAAHRALPPETRLGRSISMDNKSRRQTVD